MAINNDGFGTLFTRSTDSVPSSVTVDLYVSPSLGDDDNAGTQAEPLQSLAEALQRFPSEVGHKVNIHIRNETYVMPEDNGFFVGLSFTGGGWIRVYADEVWDPSVFTTLHTGTAQAGTSKSVFVTSGGLPGGLAHRWIEWLDGAAAGIRVQIRNVSGDDLIPVTDELAATPADGDSYRVIEPTAILVPPDPGGRVLATYPVVGDTPSPLSMTHTFADTGASSASHLDVEGFFSFEWLRFQNSPSYDSLSFGRAPVYMYGVILADTESSFFDVYRTTGVVGLGRGLSREAAYAGFASGLGIPGFENFFGSGCVFVACHAFAVVGQQAVLWGHWCVDTLGTGLSGVNQGQVWCFGGDVGVTAATARNFLLVIQGRSATPVLIRNSGISAFNLTGRPGSLQLTNVDIQSASPVVRILDDMAVYMTGGVKIKAQTPGQLVVQQSGASRIHMSSAPDVGEGGGTNDWQQDGGAAFDGKTTFASAPSSVLGAHGSLATRR